MRVECDYVKVSRKMLNPEVAREIANTENIITRKSKLIAEGSRIVREFEMEKIIIEEISSKFACFLNANAFVVSTLHLIYF